MLDVLLRAERYSPTHWDQVCNCGNDHCRIKNYGSRYFIVQFETDSLSAIYWFSRN